MDCHDRDQDLLLLTHDELSWQHRWIILAHLRTCRRCRERRAKLQRISAALAVVIRAPDVPPWRSSRRHRPVRKPIGAGEWIRLVSLALLVAVLGMLIFQIISSIWGPQA